MFLLLQYDLLKASIGVAIVCAVFIAWWAREAWRSRRMG